MGSRARVAAAACVVASGLLVGGLGVATAGADPGQSASDDTSGGKGDSASSPVRSSNNGTDTGSDDDDSDLNNDPGADDPDDAEPRDRDETEVDDPEADGEPDASAEAGLEIPGRDEEGEKRPLPPCCDEGGKDCGPWWPWPGPDPDPGEPPGLGNGGGSPGNPPIGLPFPETPIDVPPVFLPPVDDPLDPDVVEAVPGSGVAGSGLSGAPVSVPVLVVAPTGLGPGPGPTGGGAGAGLPAAPRQGSAEPPPARQPLPATAGNNAAMPASAYRVGYGEYLRTAGMSQIAVLAVPGLAGILVLTGAGGLIGYRQARAGQAVRTRSVSRYMN